MKKGISDKGFRRLAQLQKCSQNYNDADFYAALEQIVEEEGSNILSIGSIYSDLAEHFNNEILDIWSEDNPGSSLDAMNNDEFDSILAQLVNREGSFILSIGDIYSELSEEFNNEILDRLEGY